MLRGDRNISNWYIYKLEQHPDQEDLNASTTEVESTRKNGSKCTNQEDAYPGKPERGQRYMPGSHLQDAGGIKVVNVKRVK